jgi:hypothetical protein
MCIRPRLLNPRKHVDAALAVLLHVAAVATLAWYSVPTLLLAVTLPFLIAMTFGSYLFYAQHKFPSESFTIETIGVTSTPHCIRRASIAWDA